MEQSKSCRKCDTAHNPPGLRRTEQTEKASLMSYCKHAKCDESSREERIKYTFAALRHLLKHPQSKLIWTSREQLAYCWRSISQGTQWVVFHLSTPHPLALTPPCRSRSHHIVALHRYDRQRDRAHSPGTPDPWRNLHHSLPHNVHLNTQTMRVTYRLRRIHETTDRQTLPLPRR